MTALLRSVEPDERLVGKGYYTSSEVMTLTGVTYRQLDHWTRSGRLPETAHGSGYSRKFSAAEVGLVQAVLALLSVGFTLEAAFTVARSLAEQGRWAAVVGDSYLIQVSGGGPATPPKGNVTPLTNSAVMSEEASP